MTPVLCRGSLEVLGRLWQSLRPLRKAKSEIKARARLGALWQFLKNTVATHLEANSKANRKQAPHSKCFARTALKFLGIGSWYIFPCFRIAFNTQDATRPLRQIENHDKCEGWNGRGPCRGNLEFLPLALHFQHASHDKSEV